jgi:hypothetical protein
MYGEERQSEDMKAFEEELASLRPRAERLDPCWRFLLAQEAALNQNLPGSDARAAGAFVCSRCGATVSGRRDRRRWAWPAAFAAMTTVAAALLVALVFGVAGRSPLSNGRQDVSVADASGTQKQNDQRLWPAADLPLRPTASADDEPGYLNVREHVLRYGVDSWESPAPAVAATNKSERVLNYREQLDRLLTEESINGS